jgi:RNA polymerase sigma-70 factor (ECF subfamily)
LSERPTTANEKSTATANQAQFATTHWSIVLHASQRDAAGSAEALEKLCRAYWFPLYAFARREGNGPEEAQDLTQEFFSRLLAKDYLQMADPNRGRFRSFLLASFKHMIANERRNATRQKRGGGAQIFSLDDQDAEERYQLEPADMVTPDRVFERRWAETMLARVLDRLAAEYRGNSLRFDDLKVFLIEAKGAAAFGEVAARLQVTAAALKSVVHRMRRRYAALFREEVSQTVLDPLEVEDEIRHMLLVLAD